MNLVKTYFVLVGDSTLGYCQTQEEAEQWVIELKNGVFKHEPHNVYIVEDWVEEDFYDDY